MQIPRPNFNYENKFNGNVSNSQFIIDGIRKTLNTLIKINKNRNIKKEK
jgi:hypothetical protein